MNISVDCLCYIKSVGKVMISTLVKLLLNPLYVVVIRDLAVVFGSNSNQELVQHGMRDVELGEQSKIIEHFE